MLIDRCALPDARPPATTTGKIVVFEPIFFFPSSPTNSKTSRVDLAGERLGDGRRNASGHTRVEAMNDDRLEIGNDLAELRPSLPFVKIRLAADNCLVI